MQASGGVAAFIDLSVSPAGTYTLTASAGALASVTSEELTIEPEEPTDTTAPEIVAPGDMTVEATGPGGEVVTYTASATDDVDGPVEVTCTPPSGATFTLGATTVDCRAVDAAGNEATASFTITVEDTTAPVLDLPEDLTVEATGPDGATVSFTAAAFDLVDGEVQVHCTPLSGSLFPAGTSTVSCKAGDAAGNLATGSFAITVVPLDEAPPEAPTMFDELIALAQAAAADGTLVGVPPGGSGSNQGNGRSNSNPADQLLQTWLGWLDWAKSVKPTAKCAVLYAAYQFADGDFKGPPDLVAGPALEVLVPMILELIAVLTPDCAAGHIYGGQFIESPDGSPPWVDLGPPT